MIARFLRASTGATAKAAPRPFDYIRKVEQFTEICPLNLPNTLTTSNENAEIWAFEMELVAAWNEFGSFGQSGEKMKYSPFDPRATRACGLAVAWAIKA
jgi:hypothetical protein